jgi:hypothetical protein
MVTGGDHPVTTLPIDWLDFAFQGCFEAKVMEVLCTFVFRLSNLIGELRELQSNPPQTTARIFSCLSCKKTGPVRWEILAFWNLESVQAHFYSRSDNHRFTSGAGSRIRTDDLLITNQLLYQLSYAGENVPVRLGPAQFNVEDQG